MSICQRDANWHLELDAVGLSPLNAAVTPRNHLDIERDCVSGGAHCLREGGAPFQGSSRFNQAGQQRRQP